MRPAREVAAPAASAEGSPIIRNTPELLSHGNVVGRRFVLDILEAGLQASDPYDSVRRLVRVQDGKLLVGGEGPSDGRSAPPLVFDLAKVGRIYVTGGGKAAQRQAEALEDTLGDLIAGGHVNAKKGDTVRLKRIGVTLAGHPLPDEDSVEGSKRIVEWEGKARKGDIVFHSESGGGSALMTLPAPGVTLQDLKDVNRLLYFERGASMWDTNAVRNMLVLLRSREVRYAGEATFIQLSTDERPPRMRIEVGRRQHLQLAARDAYDYAIGVLKAYDCWDRVSESVRRFLLAANPAYGPLTREERARMHYYRVIGPETMLGAAERRARELGLNATIVASSLSDVEAAAAGNVLAYMAQECEMHDRPLTAPAVLICGGELVVTVGSGKGSGGRNQEFALSMAPRIAGSGRIVAASVDSDGSDGPTEQAGGIVDGLTMDRLGALGVDYFAEMAEHDSEGLLKSLEDTLDTGVLGTNVQDLRVVYVAGK